MTELTAAPLNTNRPDGRGGGPRQIAETAAGGPLAVMSLAQLLITVDVTIVNVARCQDPTHSAGGPVFT